MLEIADSLGLAIDFRQTNGEGSGLLGAGMRGRAQAS